MSDPTFAVAVSATFGSLGDVFEFIERQSRRFVPASLDVTIKTDIAGSHQGRVLNDRSFWATDYHVKVGGKLKDPLPNV